MLKRTAIKYLPSFGLLADKGGIEEEIMYNTYNMGIGMILAVSPADVDTAMEAIRGFLHFLMH